MDPDEFSPGWHRQINSLFIYKTIFYFSQWVLTMPKRFVFMVFATGNDCMEYFFEDSQIQLEPLPDAESIS